jgi:hypothetical protein
VRRVISTVILVLVAPAGLQERLQLPNKDGSVRFLVIGDSGTGGSEQRAVAARIAEIYKIFPFEFAIMVGDNLYGSEGANDFRRKFEEPYKPLLDGGVKFYAALGNHDDPTQRYYKNFNMNGERFYTFKAPQKRTRPPWRRAVLRARQQLHVARTTAVAREGAEVRWIRLEDSVLPSPALLVR